MRSAAELHDWLMVLNMFLIDKYGHVSFLGTNMLSACPTQPTIWWVEKPLIIKVWFSRTNLGWQENKINLAGKNVQPFRGGWHLCISYRRTCFSSTFCVFSELAFVVGVAFLWWERVWSLQKIYAQSRHHSGKMYPSLVFKARQYFRSSTLSPTSSSLFRGKEMMDQTVD